MKQNQRQPQQNDQQQQQNTAQSDNGDQQGGQNSQGQSGGSAGAQASGGSQKGSQRAGMTNQHGIPSNTGDDESPELNQEGEQSSSDKLRQGALDTQYGTSSWSKTDHQTNRPEGSSESTGSDRDTLSGSRSKDR